MICCMEVLKGFYLQQFSCIFSRQTIGECRFIVTFEVWLKKRLLALYLRMFLFRIVDAIKLS